MNKLSKDGQFCYRHRIRLLKDNPSLKNLSGPFYPTFLLCLALTSLQVYFSSLVEHYQLSILVIFTLSFINANSFLYSLNTLIHENSHGLITGFRFQWMTTFVIDAGVLTFGEELNYMHAHKNFHHPYLNDEKRDPECKLGQTKTFTVGKRDITLWMELLPLYSLLFSDTEATTNKAGPHDMWIQQGMCILLCIGQIGMYAYNGMYYGLLFRLWSTSLAFGRWAVLFQGQSRSEHYNDDNTEEPIRSTYRTFERIISNGTNYHREHHIIHNIPFVYLHRVADLDPEFFYGTGNYKSYARIWYEWITSDKNFRQCINE